MPGILKRSPETFSRLIDDYQKDLEKYLESLPKKDFFRSKVESKKYEAVVEAIAEVQKLNQEFKQNQTPLTINLAVERFAQLHENLQKKNVLTEVQDKSLIRRFLEFMGWPYSNRLGKLCDNDKYSKACLSSYTKNNLFEKKAVHGLEKPQEEIEKGDYEMLEEVGKIFDKLAPEQQKLFKMIAREVDRRQSILDRDDLSQHQRSYAQRRVRLWLLNHHPEIKQLYKETLVAQTAQQPPSPS